MCRAAFAHRHAHAGFDPREFYSHGPWGGFMAPGFGEEGFGPGGGFGVRRPLRFLAHKLDLDNDQVVNLARILDELKIERAQAAVDDRRALAEFADSLAGDKFDAAKAEAAGERRVESNKRLRATLVRSLEQIHAMLRPEQRSRLAHLIRAGILTV